MRARGEALRRLNPDDPRAAALFHAAVLGAEEGEEAAAAGLTREEEAALGGAGAWGMGGGGGGGKGREGASGGGGGLRMPARKRLVFSRLPSVLCFHLGRRVRCMSLLPPCVGREGGR